jgi:hypothetical protein
MAMQGPGLELHAKPGTIMTSPLAALVPDRLSPGTSQRFQSEMIAVLHRAVQGRHHMLGSVQAGGEMTLQER